MIPRAVPPLDRNGWLVMVAKAARSFGFGVLSVGLGLHLHAQGFDAVTIGVVLGAALAGTMVLTLLIALAGDRVGRRRFLVVGSLLMVLAAVIPFVGSSPLLFVLLGLTGMVAVTANESTGLHAVDQAIIPASLPSERRTDAFALYSLLAFAGTALGAAAVGPLAALATALGLPSSEIHTPAFVAYAVAGLVSAVASSALDGRAEVGERLEGRITIGRSRATVARLSLLFGLDSFAGGLIVQSFLAYWFAERFGFEAAAIGGLFFAASLLGAASFPVAARLAGRIGLIATMVVTHIPASVLLIAIALLPPELPGAAALVAALFLTRAFFSSMDVPTRQSYVMSVVDPAERTATAGVTSLARSAAQTAGPFVAGALLVPLGLAVPLVLCGALKITYDLLLWQAFRAQPAPGEPLRRSRVAGG